jgi:hypothetical protein
VRWMEGVRERGTWFFAVKVEKQAGTGGQEGLLGRFLETFWTLFEKAGGIWRDPEALRGCGPPRRQN